MIFADADQVRVAVAVDLDAAAARGLVDGDGNVKICGVTLRAAS